MDELCKRLWTNGSLRSLAMKLTGELYQDLLQEVALALLEQKKDVSSYFEFWCVRTMINMTSKNGTFWKLYSDRYIDQNEIRFQNELQYDPKADELWNELDKIFTKQEWYKRDMLKTYMMCGSYRKVEEYVGINHVSVHKTVKEAKKIINDRTDYNIN
jgi:hypothetical protein